MAKEMNKPTDWREEIGKAMDIDEKPEVEEPEIPEPETKEPDEKPRDESGKFKAKEESGEPAPETPTTKIDPPAHFTAEEKQYFSTLSPEQQEWIASSTKRMSSTVDKRLQEYSGYQRRAQAFDEALAPYRDQLTAAGMDEIATVKQLFATYAQLRRDPVNTIRWLAQQYHVDLSQQDEADPQSQQLYAHINQLQQGIQQLQGTYQNDRFTQTLSHVTKFADEKDAQGNPLRPHFEVVVDDMAKLMQSGIVQMNDLQTAYDRALSFHPELTTPVRIPQTPATKPETDPVKEAAEKAARAKRAAAGVKSGAGSPKTEAVKTQRQVIEELVSAQMK